MLEDVLGNLDTRDLLLVTLIVDMRKGYDKLASWAKGVLSIDISTQSQYLIFINRRAKSLKIIGKRENMNILLNIGLDEGTFQRVMQRAGEPGYIKLTRHEFLDYIRGHAIMTYKNHP